MYTAKLKDRVIETGVIRWVAEFTNGTDVWTESFQVPTYAKLQDRVAKRLAELNFVDTFTVGDDISSTVVDTNPVKTQAEIDMDIWFRDWRNLQHANELVTAGIILASQPQLVALKTKVTNNFKVAYVPYM
jgi:hypothetical protein